MRLPSFITGYTEHGYPYRLGLPFGIYASHLGTYMSRWILRTPWFMVRLHHIREIDADRDPHDHPFDFVSFILCGSYNEERYGIAYASGAIPCLGDRFEMVLRQRWSWSRRRAEDLHRISWLAPRTWTLVFTGPLRREWGFMTFSGWVPWKEYATVKEHFPVPEEQS